MPINGGGHRLQVVVGDDDSVGVGLGYAHVSSRASGLDGDVATFTGSYNPPRSSETFLELTYLYAVTPWMQFQPDIQYVFNPGAGVANPNGSGQKINDELVIGVRTNILF